VKEAASLREELSVKKGKAIDSNPERPIPPIEPDSEKAQRPLHLDLSVWSCMTQMKMVRRRPTEQQVGREVVVVDDGQGVLVVVLAHPAAPVTHYQMRGHPHPHHPDHRGGPPPGSETQGGHLPGGGCGIANIHHHRTSSKIWSVSRSKNLC